jgi:hypothetical protein
MMRRALASLLVLLPLAGCADEQPLSPREAARDPEARGFALGRPSALPVPLRAARSSAPSITVSPELASSTGPATGPSHIVWQNARTGQRLFWHMSGTAWGGGQNEFTTIDPAWTIAASADFTGDGQADLLWQRRATGDQVIWHMNGFGWTGQQTALTQVQPDWWIVGAGDFTADGKPDIVWQNRKEGRQVIWHMNGTTWGGAQNELPQVAASWWIAGVGDFTGDGRPDLVWQDQSAGRQLIWHMNGTSWGGAQNELPQVSPDWHVAGAGDFTADRGADILFQNRKLGRQVIWHMNGTAWPGGQNELPQVLSEWHIATTLPARPSTAVQAPSEALHKVSYTAFRKPPYGFKAATPWLAFVHTGAAGVASSADIDHIQLWAEINGVAMMVDSNSYNDSNYGGQLRNRNPWFDDVIENMPVPPAPRNGVLTIRTGDRPDKVWHPFLGTWPNPRKDLSAATRVWFVARVRLHGPVAVQGGIDYYRDLSGYDGTNRLEEGSATDWEYAREEWINLTMERSTEVLNPIQLSPSAGNGTYPAGSPITATFTLQNSDDDDIRLSGVGIHTIRLTTDNPHCDPYYREPVSAFAWLLDADLAPGRAVTHTSTWNAPAAGDYCIRVVEQRRGVYHRAGPETGKPLYQQPYASAGFQVIRVR